MERKKNYPDPKKLYKFFLSEDYQSKLNEANQVDSQIQQGFDSVQKYLDFTLMSDDQILK